MGAHLPVRAEAHRRGARGGRRVAAARRAARPTRAATSSARSTSGTRACGRDLGRALGHAIAEKPAAPAFDVEILQTGREHALQLGELAQGTIVENRELVNVAAMDPARMRSKRHLQIALPAGMTYRSGDYLAVLPRNAPSIVQRALRRFGLANDTQIVIHRPSSTAASSATLPSRLSDQRVRGAVELRRARRSRRRARRSISSPRRPRAAPEARTLDALDHGRGLRTRRARPARQRARPRRTHGVVRPSVRALPRDAAAVARSTVLDLVVAARDDAEASLTIAVVDAPSLSGQGRFLGVASTYLASLQPGDRLAVAVRPSQSGFHPPADPADADRDGLRRHRRRAVPRLPAGAGGAEGRGSRRRTRLAVLRRRRSGRRLSVSRRVRRRGRRPASSRCGRRSPRSPTAT